MAASRAVTSTGLNGIVYEIRICLRSYSTHLAAPKGLGLDAVEEKVADLGEVAGVGWEEPLRGRSSSFFRPIWGVGGTEFVARLYHDRIQQKEPRKK